MSDMYKKIDKYIQNEYRQFSKYTMGCGRNSLCTICMIDKSLPPKDCMMYEHSTGTGIFSSPSAFTHDKCLRTKSSVIRL